MRATRLPLFLWFLVGAAIVASAIAAAPTGSEQDAAASQLRTLLKERRDTLRQLVDYSDSAFRQGIGTQESVMLASGELLEAELDMAETKAERIAIREKMVENLRRLEKWVEAKAEVGQTQQGELLRAKADRLKAEIELLREKDE